jgi:hypothetical protein
MKIIICLVALLAIATTDLSALAPYAGLNKRHDAYASEICLCEKEDETLLVAKYSDGIIYTVMTGFRAGFQWIEEGDIFKDSAYDVEWHHNSFTHTYKGGKVKTYTVGQGTTYGQTVKYNNKGKK